MLLRVLTKSFSLFLILSLKLSIVVDVSNDNVDDDDHVSSAVVNTSSM